MKKVVVFGGCGFLGGYISNELERRGYKVVVADIRQSNCLKNVQQFKEVDIMDINSILEVIKGAHIVYNFAAIADLEDAINLPVEAININVIGNLNILEACRGTKTIERFVYASSAYALSDEGSFYGISKQTSEKLTEEYYKRYGLIYTVIRYGSIYGEKPSHNNYIYNLIKDSMISGRLEYKGDGQDIREYIHASDVAKLSVDIIEDSQYENEHIILTGIEKLKRIELLTMISEIMKDKLTIERVDNSNFGHYKITPYSFHPTVAKKLVANPYIDLGQGLLECIQEIHKELTSK
jgi:UDP-glucose 4-epimerase